MKLMKLKLLSPIICRSPLFSYTEKLENVWEELKEAINLSSNDLYGQIKDISAADLDQLDPKIKFACWKYFNRARFRSTPFGLFGSITPVPLGVGGDDNQLIISKEIKRHEFIDWSNKDYLLNDIDNLFSQASFFLSNSTIYPCGNQLRYISIVDNTFEISGIENQPVIKSVLDFCQEEQSKDNVLDYLTQDRELQVSVAEDLLKQLIELQLVITDIHPNIIGTDYFERMKIKPNTDSKPYLIAERNLLKGQLDPKTLKVIPEAILFLKDHLPVQKNQALETFKHQFQRKFEYKEVPLLIALDPELGVGYDGLEMAPLPNPLIDYLKERDQSKNKSSEIPYTPLHQFILGKIFQNKEVKLEEFNPNTNTKLDNIKIPSTFSAIVQFDGRKIILTQAGGCTANALLGRFTLANNEIQEHCKNIVKIEREANSDTLFVDIGYQVEKSIDNINRRKNIYGQELAILAYPNKLEQLLFDDLLVSVVTDEIFLRSKKYNKRIIPRVASAYNSTRSDLSLYRFLSDLQNQDLQTNLSIQAQNLFPNLDYYPRLNYKNIILSSKMWRVPRQFCNPHGLLTEQLDSLKVWLKNKEVSTYFKCGAADQHLYFKSTNEEDLNHFLQYCREKELLYIIEVFMPDENISKNENNQSYHSEFIIALAHTASIYSPVKRDGLELISQHASIQLPGEEWLYFEIYMHHLRTNFFLTNILPSFLKKIGTQIKNWFFIRYNQPSSHIRIRLHKKENVDVSLLINTLSNLLASDIKDGIISDVQIKPYFREIERYGVKTIDEVEKYFGVDSKYVLQLLQLQLEDPILYFFTLQFINNIFLQLNLSIPEQLIYVKKIAKNLAHEIKVNKFGFKKINEHYELIKAYKNLKTPKVIEKKQLKSALRVVKMVKNSEQSKRFQLLTDIIHMHINRLFITDQRMHEMIIYQYLQKLLMEKQYYSITQV
jgi:lantibiotic biosynthesis protein